MNAFTESVIGTIRREVLDHFLLFLENQVRKIIREYIDYYNHLRPHQSFEGITEGNITQTSGNIRKEQILGVLHHNYYRSSA
ncbi:MAG: integrase core domain-containing protein [Spirochaetaceae bacterium]|nr:integrase core domain-containing protein [Spirochaetaceae bacterium]